MSQVDFLRQLDADIVSAFRATGLSDVADYAPPGGAVVPGVDALVDRAIALYGDDGATVVGYRNTVTLYRAQVDNPERGGTITIGGEVFVLDEMEARDESMSRWVVVDG